MMVTRKRANKFRPFPLVIFYRFILLISLSSVQLFLTVSSGIRYFETMEAEKDNRDKVIFVLNQ